MENTGNFYLVFVTVGSQENASAIARTLVEERLAACCTLIGGVTSVYRWQGQIEESREIQIIIKTSDEQLDAVERRIREVHSYDVPEILAVPIASVSAPYLAWLKESLDMATGE